MIEPSNRSRSIRGAMRRGLRRVRRIRRRSGAVVLPMSFPLLLLLLLAGQLGCGAEDAPSDGVAGRLSPSGPLAGGPGWDPAESRRIQAFLDARYTSADVRHAFRSRFGENIECIDFYAQAGVKALLAQGVPREEIPRFPSTAAPADRAGEFGFAGDPDDQGRARVCPEGSVPAFAVTADDVRRAGGLDAYRAGLRRVPPRLRAAKAAARERILPATACDTQFGYDFPHYGHVQQTFNVNNTDILSAGTATMSIHSPVFPAVPNSAAIRAQTWMYSGWGVNSADLGCTCGGKGQPPCTQSVEAGWDIEPFYYGDNSPRLFTFSTNDGYASGCWGRGQCDATAPQWIQTSPTYLPEMKLATSQLFGAQKEIQLAIFYIAISGGTWTVTTGAEVIGYFPSRYFTGAMRSKAQTYQAGGEIYDSSDSWVVPMGSGAQADLGYGQSAYVHDVKACKDSGTTCINPASFSPVLTRAGNYKVGTAGKPSGSTWTNWFYYGDTPSVFWGQNYGYQWAPQGKDWAVGDYKGECGLTNNIGQPLIGVSAFTGGSHQAHAVQCGTRSVSTTPSSCYARRIPPNSQGTSEDWDPGYYKASCKATEYVLGVSQSSTGALTGVLCCPGGSAVTHTSCTTQVLYGQNSAAYYSNAGGDWDAGYGKGQCPNGQYVAGVSALASSAQGVLYAPHAVLCCPFK